MNNLNETDNEQFNLSLEGYEGPIDLLLELAKTQKVDLSNISILLLAEQYLAYINKVNKINLEIASDYLLMAAWLTYLKSRLLLPKESDYEPSNEELEEAVKFQLKRLEAMQNASKKLFMLPQQGKDFFYRGNNDEIKYKVEVTYTSTLFDLLKAYGSQINRDKVTTLKIESSDLYSVDDAIDRLKRKLTNNHEWVEFKRILPEPSQNYLINKSAISSTFVASLELTKNGIIDVKQNDVYGPIFLKSKL